MYIIQNTLEKSVFLWRRSVIICIVYTGTVIATYTHIPIAVAQRAHVEHCNVVVYTKAVESIVVVFSVEFDIIFRLAIATWEQFCNKNDI